MFGAIPRKSVLCVRHRIRRIRNYKSDEEVIKKRKLKNQRENEENGNDDVDGSENKGKIRKCMFILKWQIFTLILQVSLHSSPYILVLNCNLVRKLIPN